jgi:hypothetical protein
MEDSVEDTESRVAVEGIVRGILVVDAEVDSEQNLEGDCNNLLEDHSLDSLEEDTVLDEEVLQG